MDIDSLIDGFLLTLRIRGFSLNTVMSYSSDLKDFSSFFSNCVINNENILKFIDKYILGRYKVSTINRKLSSIRAFVKFLVKQGYDLDAGLIKNLRFSREPPVYVASEKILKAMENGRDGLIVQLMYAAGLRVSELAGLKISDILFDAGFLRVRGKGSKERFVPVNKDTLLKIKRYIENERSLVKNSGNIDYLFLSSRGKPFTRQGLWKIVKKRFKIFGINVHPHTLRHMFATHMIENGANIRAVQEMLGHKSVTTTQIYTDISDKALERVFHKLEI